MGYLIYLLNCLLEYSEIPKGREEKTLKTKGFIFRIKIPTQSSLLFLFLFRGSYRYYFLKKLVSLQNYK